jgi:hypothetical protein
LAFISYRGRLLADASATGTLSRRKDLKQAMSELVKRGERLFFQVPSGYTLDTEAIGKAVAEERESRS